MEEARLIFGPLVRVSTERQEKKGESLNTQRKQLEKAIESLGGEVYKWYEGQEHATPDQERKILDRLMRDAENKKFDAVIVADASRWSRDNLKSSQDLEILRKSGIGFYAGTQKYDLHNHHDELFLTVGVAMNQFFAREQAYKSIINRIERAKKGYPACGMKPWGRIFDTETCVWKVDEEKKRTIEHIAHLYLEEDVPFSALSQRFRMNANNIHRILTSRCGVTWEQRFRNKRCGIDDKVVTIIPRLLPEEEINRIRAKCKARRTWDHASQKYPYLFSRLIFDEDTGGALTGTTNRWGQRYYRRYKGKGYLYMVNANVIEKAIMEGLIEALSTDKAMMRAVFNEQRLDEVGEEWKNKRGCLEREIEQVEKKRANLMRAILALDTDRVDVFVAKIKSEIKDLEEEERKIRLQIEEINERLSSLPAEKEIVDRRRWIHGQLMKRMTESYFSSGRTLDDLSFKEKQRIFKLIFGREENKGKSYGIFVKCLGGQPRKFRFEACGRLGNLEGWIVSSKGKVSSFADGELETSNDAEVIGSIARIIMESDPGGNFKEYTRSSCHV